MNIRFKSNLVKKVISDSSFYFVRMPQRIPFVMTRAEGNEGFPAMLQDLMWCANFSYAPEYFVYTTKIGPNLVEFYASVLLHPRLMTGPPERSHIFLVLEVLLKLQSKPVPTMPLPALDADTQNLTIPIPLPTSLIELPGV